MTGCYLVNESHVPARARFPVIDAHNHLWADWRSVDQVVTVMDKVGVAGYCDLTTNVRLRWVEGGYTFESGDIEEFFSNAADRFPGRFYGFTMATFARPVDQPLFHDVSCFVEETIALLRTHVERGACGLKILKELGLRYRDEGGELIGIDDERLAPVWQEAGRLGVPVLMHQSDPVGFFDPVEPGNEHYESLRKYPSWSFADPCYARKRELIAARDRVVRTHPATTFILPHVANFAEDLGYVDGLLRENPNVVIDVSARCDELGRQPYTAREFIIRHQDRILFGTDMPASVEMYRFHFRFLETFDEHFVPPDYDGTFGRHRWRVCGLGLPDDVLKKLYHGNVCRLIPRLAEVVQRCR